MTRPTRGGRLRYLAATAGAVGVLAAGLSLTLGAASSGPASADALCDQMRAQYGPDWPCINVPTYTPPPTQNEPPPLAPGETGAPGSGPNIGGSPGTGPGEGNGTPIVPGPGQGQVPQVPGRQTAPTQVNPNPTAPEIPGRTQAPATVEPGSTDSGPEPVFQPLPATDNPSEPGTGGIPTPAWLLVGTAALVAGAPRSLLRRGGSTRGQIGPSRMVLIHDETSPNTYRFTMDVPEGGYTKVNPDGSATVYDKDGNAIRQVHRPWAFDAAGRPQETWYEVDENGDLIQHVEPADNALYPILADPTQEELEAAERAQVAGLQAQMSDSASPAPPEAFVESNPGAIRQEAPPSSPKLPFGVTGDRPVQPGRVRIIDGEPSFMDVAISPLGPSDSPPEPGHLYVETDTNGNQRMYRVDQAPDGTIIERAVTGVEETAQGKRFTFEDGSYQEGDTVFGKDGFPENKSLTEALYPDWVSNPGDAGGDGIAAGQSMSAVDIARAQLGLPMRGDLIQQRRLPDGTVERYLVVPNPDGTYTKKTVKNPIGEDPVAFDGQRVFEFEDGTAQVGDGRRTYRDIDGNFWIVDKAADGSEVHTTIDGGRKFEYTYTLLPDGKIGVSGNDYYRGLFDKDGNLISERVLASGQAHADSTPAVLVLETLIPIGRAIRGGAAAWRFLRGRKPPAKPEIKEPKSIGHRANPGQTRFTEKAVERGTESNSSASSVTTQGISTIKKSGGNAWQTLQKLPDRGKPMTETRTPNAGPNMGPSAGGLQIDGGAVLVIIATVLIIIGKWLKGIRGRGK